MCAVKSSHQYVKKQTLIIREYKKNPADRAVKSSLNPSPVVVHAKCTGEIHHKVFMYNKLQWQLALMANCELNTNKKVHCCYLMLIKFHTRQTLNTVYKHTSVDKSIDQF